jgi:ferredoxin
MSKTYSKKEVRRFFDRLISTFKKKKTHLEKKIEKKKKKKKKCPLIVNGAKCDAQLCKACEKAVYTIDRVAIDDEIYHSTRHSHG